MTTNMRDFDEDDLNTDSEIDYNININDKKVQVEANTARNVAPDIKITENAEYGAVFDINNPAFTTAAGVAVSKKISDLLTADVSDTAGAEIKKDDISVNRSQNVSVTYDNGTLKETVSYDNGVNISAKNGVDFSSKQSNKTTVNGVTTTESLSQKVGFDGKKSSLNSGYSVSRKAGNDKNSVENNMSVSGGITSDGEISQKISAGTNVKVGNIEAGSSVSVNSQTSENSEATSVEAKNNYAVQTSSGTKLTHETSVESSEKVTQGEDKTVTEEEFNIKSKTRIEVDAENASAAEVIGAAVFNTQAAITEGVINTAMSYKSETTEEHSESAAESNGEQISEGYDYYSGYGY